MKVPLIKILTKYADKRRIEKDKERGTLE